jgi:predicted O-methyltransferase YrrM
MESFDAVLADYHARIAAQRQTPATSDDQRFLAVGPEAGQFLAFIALSMERPRVLELGTSLGYSTLWLAGAAKAAGGSVVTVEMSAVKSAEAARMLGRCGLADVVDFQVGDALTILAGLRGPFDLILLDLWKDLYVACFEAMRPLLAPDALVVADNMLQGGGPGIDAYAARVRTDPGLRSVLVPVGNGLELTRPA